MKIVVCYKNTPDLDSFKIEAGKESEILSAPISIGQYDLNALEAAVQLGAQAGETEIIALTVAGAAIDNSKQRKAILSRGANKMLGIQDGAFDSADSLTIARAIKKAVENIGDVDLVLFGEGSADMYAQQMGSMVGALLGWNELNSIGKMELEGDRLLVKRELEAYSDWYRVSFPAVISVTSDINKPRIPSMKEILAAGKKPVEVLKASEIGLNTESKVQTVSILAPQGTERKKQVYQVVSDEAIEVLAREIRKTI